MHAIAQTFNKRRGSKITTILTGEVRDGLRGGAGGIIFECLDTQK